ncbi:MAG: hypothetical protein JNL74_21560 [Fibrobacteres bacterium]|nr:hypothetical protein [Fibrobacterota bacterium]
MKLFSVLILLACLMQTLYSDTLSVLSSPFNAKGDSLTNDRIAIQKAIDSAFSAGGGVVVLPSGRNYVTGNLFLKSKVTLHIDSGATLLASLNAADYTYASIIPWQPTSIKWDITAAHYYPLIYAGPTERNVGVTGKGTINMRDWKSSVLTFFEVDSFVLSDFKVRLAGTWQISIRGCKHGLLSNLDLRDPAPGAKNVDGIALNGQHIRVTGCEVHSQDDGIYPYTVYNDPRRDVWWNADNPIPSTNIEIDHCNVTSSGGRPFRLIPWGTEHPDPGKLYMSDIFYHDNTGIIDATEWYDDPYSGSTYSRGGEWDFAPIWNIRFQMSDSSKTWLSSQRFIYNGDFEKCQRSWWSIIPNSSQNSAGVSDSAAGQQGRNFGYIRNLGSGPASIFQQVHLASYADSLQSTTGPWDTRYRLQARVKTGGNPVRLFVRTSDKQDSIASTEIQSVNWTPAEIIFKVPAGKSFNTSYDAGLTGGMVSGGWGFIDSMTLSHIMPFDNAPESYRESFADSSFEKNWMERNGQWTPDTFPGTYVTSSGSAAYNQQLNGSGRVSVKMLVGSSKPNLKAGIMLRYQDSLNYYFLGEVGYNNRPVLAKMTNGVFNIIVRITSTWPPAPVQWLNRTYWYTLTAIDSGSYVGLYINGIFVFRQNVGPNTGGKAGLLVSACRRTFKDFTIQGFGTPTAVEKAKIEIIEPLNLTCHPNPFNPSVSIEFKGRFVKASIKVLNVSGKQITSFTLDGSKASKFVWKTEGLASGSYFVSTDVDGRRIIREIKLIR